MVESEIMAEAPDSLHIISSTSDRSSRCLYSAQGIVHSIYHDRTSFYASGTLISPRLVLTSASGVYSLHKKVHPNFINFIPLILDTTTRSLRLREISSIKVIEIFFSDDYKTSGEDSYAMVVLEEDIPFKVQYYKMKYFRVEEIANYRPSIFAYSSDIPEGFGNDNCMQETLLDCEVDELEDKICYNMHDSTALTGSAVYIEKEDEFYIIGIHIESHDQSTGIYLNQARLNVLQKCMRQYLAKYQAATENSLYSFPSMISDAYLEISQGFKCDDFLIVRPADQLPLNLEGLVHIECHGEINYYHKGYIVGPRFVLAAASIILESAKEGRLKSIHFSPYKNKYSSNPVKVIDMRRLRSGRAEERYCLLILSRKITDFSDCFLLKPFPDRIYSMNKAGIYIHPYIIMDRRDSIQDSNMSIPEVLERMSAYNMFYTSGIREAAIYIQQDIQFYLIGIYGEENYSSCSILEPYHLNPDRIFKIRDIMSRYYLKNIKCMKLSSKSLEDNILPDLALRNYRNLVTLDLSFNNITAEGSYILASGVLYSLVTLNLAFNRLGPIGVESIFRGRFPYLKNLNLDGNRIGDGNIFIATSLKLRTLSLMGNGIGDNGAFSLSMCMFDLIDLNLSSNAIRDRGAFDISLGFLGGLKYLNLENNYIGYNGGRALAYGNFHRIIHLNLGGNRIQDRGANMFRFSRYPVIEILDLSDNDISHFMKQRLNRVYEWRLII